MHARMVVMLITDSSPLTLRMCLLSRHRAAATRWMVCPSHCPAVFSLCSNSFVSFACPLSHLCKGRPVHADTLNGAFGHSRCAHRQARHQRLLAKHLSIFLRFTQNKHKKKRTVQRSGQGGSSAFEVNTQKRGGLQQRRGQHARISPENIKQ